MENRKNTILLTVIAVATLLVAVVGATFAYFTAQGGGTATTPITVTTSTSSNSSFDLAAALSITANQDTFAEGAADHLKDEQTGTVNWTPSDAASGAALNFCYTVDLEISANTFEYITSEDAEKGITSEYLNTPEILFNISKNGTPIQTTGVTGLTYATVGTTKTGTRPEVSGWDITTAKATYNIPGKISAGSAMVHQMVGEAGVKSTDTWLASVTLVNLNVDQQHNTNKSLSGTLRFTAVDCTTGTAS